MPKIYTNDGCIHYDVYGHGIPIIFIHPPILSSRNFIYQQKYLSEFYQVITFDIRGHGRSMPSDQPITYSLISKDIHDLMDHLQIEKAYLCGYSMGGSVALDFLLAYPERGLGAIIIGGFSEVHDWRLKKEIQVATSLITLKAISIVAHSVSWGNADRLLTYQYLLEDAKRACSQNVKQYFRNALTFNCTQLLSQIEAPILLLYGKNDRVFYQYGQMINEKVANSDLRLIHRCKHQLPTKKYKEVNRFIIEFISSLPI